MQRPRAADPSAGLKRPVRWGAQPSENASAGDESAPERRISAMSPDEAKPTTRGTTLTPRSPSDGVSDVFARRTDGAYAAA